MSGSDSNGRPGTLPDESGSSAASASSAGSSGGSVSDSDDWEVAAADIELWTLLEEGFVNE